MSYFIGYKYCAQKCKQTQFMVSTIIEILAVVPLLQMFSINFFGRNVAGIASLLICTILLCLGSLVLILPRFTIETEDHTLGYIWIGIAILSAIIILILPTPLRVIITQYYILFALCAIYLSKILDTQNILSTVGRASFASYLPLVGGIALAYQLKCETYGKDKYELF